MVIQCKNLISLYILPDQRRVNLLVLTYYSNLPLHLHHTLLILDPVWSVSNVIHLVVNSTKLDKKFCHKNVTFKADA